MQGRGTLQVDCSGSLVRVSLTSHLKILVPQVCQTMISMEDLLIVPPVKVSANQFSYFEPFQDRLVIQLFGE